MYLCCVVLQPNCRTNRFGVSWVAMPLREEWRIESDAMSHGYDSPESSRCVVLCCVVV